MTASPDTRAALPPEAAFVVQFSAAADLPRGRIEGRVEHVASGQATRFESLEGLAAFFSYVLAGAPSP